MASSTFFCLALLGFHPLCRFSGTTYGQSAHRWTSPQMQDFGAAAGVEFPRNVAELFVLEEESAAKAEWDSALLGLYNC